MNQLQKEFTLRRTGATTEMRSTKKLKLPLIKTITSFTWVEDEDDDESPVE